MRWTVSVAIGGGTIGNCKRMHSTEIQSQLMISRPALFKWDDSIFTALCAKLDLMEEFFGIPKMQSLIEEIYRVNKQKL
ncbi:MAG: hypothetical protein Q7S59_05950 [Sulfurimonas sp.]|nr:hypothetical protein [Sulfurimonas sp.]